jgi:hypothetical protein
MIRVDRMTMIAMARRWSAGGALLLLLGLSACLKPYYGDTAVVGAPPDTAKRFRSITVQEASSTAATAPEAANLFRERLETRFADRQVPFGRDLTVSYQIVSFDPGDRAARWVGFGGGIGTLAVEIVYTDRSGQQVGKVLTDGKVIGGFLGGDSDLAARNAAYEVVEYTVETFGLPNGPPPSPRGAIRHRAPVRVD